MNRRVFPSPLKVTAAPPSAQLSWGRAASEGTPCRPPHTRRRAGGLGGTERARVPAPGPAALRGCPGSLRGWPRSLGGRLCDRPSDVSCAMCFPCGVDGPRHPSSLSFFIVPFAHRVPACPCHVAVDIRTHEINRGHHLSAHRRALSFDGVWPAVSDVTTDRLGLSFTCEVYYPLTWFLVFPVSLCGSEQASSFPVLFPLCCSLLQPRTPGIPAPGVSSVIRVWNPANPLKPPAPRAPQRAGNRARPEPPLPTGPAGSQALRTGRFCSRTSDGSAPVRLGISEGSVELLLLLPSCGVGIVHT